MSDTDRQSVTDLLRRVAEGNEEAFDEAVPLVYEQLRHLAARQRRRWEGNETMNTTALVHEAYFRLVGQPAGGWQSRAHFLAVASTALRQVLLDYAKRARASKRGGGRFPVSLDEFDEIGAITTGGDAADTRSELLLALDAALRRLEHHDARQARIIECRFFGGMSIPDTAEALGISPATVKRGWSMAQAWLYRELRRDLEGVS